ADAAALTPLLTNFIVGETHGLVLSRLGAGFARRWLFGNVCPIERVMADDETRARDDELQRDAAPRDQPGFHLRLAFRAVRVSSSSADASRRTSRHFPGLAPGSALVS